MSSWFDGYKVWVRTHSKLIGAAEDALSHLSWVLPERFSGSEVVLESFHSALGVLSLWHDSITSGAIDSGVPWPLVLGAIRRVEVLFEMRASYLDKLGKWNKFGPLSALEMTKLFLRMLMYRAKGGRLAVHETEMPSPDASGELPLPAERAPSVIRAFERLKGRRVSLPMTADDMCRQNSGSPSNSRSQSTLECIPEEEIEVSAGPGSDNERLQNSNSSPTEHGQETSTTATAQPHSSLDQSDPTTSTRMHWWERPVAAHHRIPRPSSPAPRSTNTIRGGPELQYALGERLMLIGEIMNLIRPVVYVMALGKFGNRAWRGWFISLSLDLISHSLIAKGSALMRDSGVSAAPSLSLQDGILTFLLRLRNFEWTPQEEDELARRKRLLLLYLLRSPFFDMITRRVVSTAQGAVGPIPLIGALGSKAVEILYGIQHYYCYTSGS
ncbi:hypothetical protein BSKO_01089 [Bryopsis sp. KO-2023]|nr:hypothetical protein BSKO_01089 [Bryopsis sp. KO-2023]